MRRRTSGTAGLAAGCSVVMALLGACSSSATPDGTTGGIGEAGVIGVDGSGSGGDEGGTGSGSGGHGHGGSGGGSGGSGGGRGGSGGGSGGDASTGGHKDGGKGSFGGSDASLAYDAIDSADVQWGKACLYNFGTSCPFSNPQECGNHQGIAVTFPNGPQLLNATLFAGLGCSPTAFTDNFNDQQNTRPSDLWMFTDDAEVAGVSASNPTSVIWWVGPLTSDGFPPKGAPTTGCIDYTLATPTCP